MLQKRHFGRDAKIQRPRMASFGLPRQLNQRCLHQRQVTVHGLTAIQVAAHQDEGVGFSPRPDTYRSLKAAPTGLT